MTKKERQREQILRHGLRLQRIFKTGDRIGPDALARRLHRIEAEAHRLAERECNEQLPEGYSEKVEASILRRLDVLLGFKALGIPVIVNGDPRGYALKIDDAWMREHCDIELHRDMGGYGIIAPELDGES